MKVPSENGSVNFIGILFVRDSRLVKRVSVVRNKLWVMSLVLKYEMADYNLE